MSLKKKTMKTTLLSIISEIIKHCFRIDLYASITHRQKQNLLGRMLYKCKISNSSPKNKTVREQSLRKHS